MSDVLLVGTIVVFFLAAALLVRVLGRVVDDTAGDDADRGEPHEPDPEPGRPA